MAASEDTCENLPQEAAIRRSGAGQNVLRYLARYVKRSAISDKRITREVVFGYRDSATQQRRTCTLSAEEFLRRYLQHVPPPGQRFCLRQNAVHRVRYFGWMHPAARRRRMIVETLLEKLILVTPPADPPRWHLRCPHCEAFALVVVDIIPRIARAPP